jgi:hypothetical protein
MLYNDHVDYCDDFSSLEISPLLRDCKLYTISQVTSHIFVLALINIQMCAKKRSKAVQGANCYKFIFETQHTHTCTK